MMGMFALSCNSSDFLPYGEKAGDPIPGVSVEREQRFLAGKALFHKQFMATEGLGPLFNQDRCSSCHDIPALGGFGTEDVTKATAFLASNQCDLLVDEGGDNIQQRATVALQAYGVQREPVPTRATARARITAPALFGLGLVEAVSIADLQALSDPEDLNGDGVSGRVGSTADGRPARFGRKADIASLSDFLDTAFRFEMGLTTPMHPEESRIGWVGLPDSIDTAADPEVDGREFDAVLDYVRLLAPLAPEIPASSATRDTIAKGRELFARVGCSNCHTPYLRTSRSRDLSFDRVTFQVYSDFLLHDLGPSLADICGVSASPAEHRTSSLVGIRYRTGLLHDGRAVSVRSALELHGGEATAARIALRALSPVDQTALIRFVYSR